MTERKSTTTFTYHDPGRTFDGTPYEAAGKATEQTSNVARLLHQALQDTEIQARNAFMQRNLDLHGEARADEWEGSAEQKMLAKFRVAVGAIVRKLAVLHRSLTYDPKSAPKD